jgi:hypothetical protein
MGNVIAYFLQPHVLVRGAGVVLVAVACTWLLRRRLRGRGRTLLFLAFLLSAGLVVLVTLLREPTFTFCPSCVGEWWGVDKILAGAVGTDVLLNVLLFVPPVLLATLLWRAPWRTVGIAALASLGIELLQALIGAGASDWMDVLVNTVGALIGAGLGALVLWVRDVIVDRRVDIGRTVRLAASLAAGVALFVGGPALLASDRQALGVKLMMGSFAGTTLADYEANRDTAWESKVHVFWEETGEPTMTSRGDDTVARERATWNIYFAVRCVIGEWTPTGFSTITSSGTACTAPLELHN